MESVLHNKIIPIILVQPRMGRVASSNPEALSNADSLIDFPTFLPSRVVFTTLPLAFPGVDVSNVPPSESTKRQGEI